MYIKQIIIQGFKSYKDQTEIAPFSPKDNVIVGKNGSGKSNFFAAVRFVLGDSYNQMSREERNALLHEGSGSAVMSAYVEVIFDNSDDRFPTGKPETILRRTIGIKKDEYAIDRKNSTKADVMSLLESAGFSKSNPYYIVPQGRITALTNMKDPERLALLKDVAGTQVYEARRQESLKILTETENKQTQIDGLLTVIHERLDELEQEKEELSEYQGQDRERRVLEYTFHSRELQKVTQQLENLEDRRLQKADENDERARQAEEIAHEIGEIQKRIQLGLQDINILKDDRAQCDSDYRTAKSEQTRSRLEIENLKEGQTEVDQARSEYARKLSSIEARIQEYQAELERVLPEYNQVKSEEQVVKSQLDIEESTQRRLRGKQQYTSKQDRDAALQKQIEGINTDLGRRKANASHNADVIAELEGTISTLESEVQQIQADLGKGQHDAQQFPEVIAKIEKEIAELDDEQKGVAREESQIYNRIKTAEEDLRSSVQALSKLTDRNTINGINAVRQMQAKGVQGIYGTLAELIKVKEGYKIAAEVIGQQSFFNVVVDNDETANKIIKELQANKAGRITAMPLNRIHNKQVQFPKVNDAQPLISKMDFDPMFKPAVEHIFGQTIVCPGMNVAGDYARNHGLTAVDIQGNRADKKGAYTGGWFDPSRSRMDAVKNERVARDTLDNLVAQSKELSQRKEQLAQRITSKKGERTKAEVARSRAEREYRSLQEGLQHRLQQLPIRQNELEQKRLKQQEDNSEYSRIDDELTSLQNELQSPFQPKLSKDEARKLEQLNTSIPKLKKQYLELNTRRNDLEAQKMNLEFELKQNLQPTLNQLKASDLGGSGSAFGASTKLQEAERRLQRATTAVKSAKKALEEREKELEAANKQVSALQKALAEKELEQSMLKEEIDKYNKRLANSHSERANLTMRAENCKRAIDDLGSLPSNANEQKYRKWDAEKITKRLKQIRETLKKYTHVNKKAVEQYNNFTTQREKLQRRRSELDSSYKSINDLIEHLDQRKDQAIERTFKQVSREFAWVFKQLVPAGRGRLVIQRKSDRQVRRPEDEESEEEQDKSSVQNYTGVGISVSFNSEHDEQQRVQQLSGGQKSLCALALVFAIQRCDPAPFYIFDEIDANLDAQYRTAVANMLKVLAEPAEDGTGGGQFICTTFSRELIVVADKCYLVTFSNKTSSIDVVYKEDALKFVEDQKRAGAQ